MTTQKLDEILQEPELAAVLKTTEWTAAQALMVLRAQQRSGLTVQGFTRQVGIPTWRLYKWRLRLQKELAEEPAPVELPSEPPLPAAFVPVSVPAPVSQPACATLPSACAELVVPSGLRVRLTAQTPPSWLPLLCQALRAAC